MSDDGSEGRRRISVKILWLASLLLWLPVLIPFVCHYRLLPKPEMPQGKLMLPTGFIQYDQPYYMMNAGAHFDKDGFHLLYGLPFSPDEDTPRIYFQPHVLVMGLIWKATSLDPAIVYLSFGFLSGWICLRVALALFDELFGLASLSQWLVAILWTWGGGLLTLLGSVRYFWTKDLDDLFYFEPAGGMWFLNLGRNLIYPMEAYYHALFLGVILQIIRKRYWGSLLLAVLLSMSHPFTGIELILIVVGWALLERCWIGNREVSTLWLASMFTLGLAHLGYYFGFLRMFPEHRSVQLQWTQEWTYEIQHFSLAYGLVGIFAFWSLRNLPLARTTLSTTRNRLFLIWFLVAFALANHEFAIRPAIQPMHFTRGYVWMPLFLLGGPVLLQLMSRRWGNPFQRWIGATLLSSLFLMDNVLFLTTFHFRDTTLEPQLYVSESYYEIRSVLNQPEQRGALIVSPFPPLNYWLLLHCPVRAWYSHVFNTPDSELRFQELKRFFEQGEFLQAWKDRIVVIILPSNFGPDTNPKLGEIFRAINIQPLHANADYHLYRYSPP
jgi:hypothetical protein